MDDLMDAGGVKDREIKSLKRKLEEVAEARDLCVGAVRKELVKEKKRRVQENEKAAAAVDFYDKYKILEPLLKFKVVELNGGGAQ